MELQRRLFALQDPGYRDFQSRLMPTVNPAGIIGVRVPALRKLAKEFAKTPEAEEFLHTLPHQYYEENNVHAALINGIRDYGEAVAALDAFLPYVDNWATCDLLSPVAFKKHPAGLPEQAQRWMAAGDTYTVRFGIGVLMGLYLDEAFEPKHLDWVTEVQSNKYYVNMMIAWYFATALAKQYEAALPYLQARRLDPWTHNKAIQKAMESYRVTEERKIYLRTLKVKKA